VGWQGGYIGGYHGGWLGSLAALAAPVFVFLRSIRLGAARLTNIRVKQ